MTEWEALEAAFELSWKLNRCPSNGSTTKLSSPTYGRGRNVQFSSCVDVCFYSPVDSVRVSYKTTHEAISQWPKKPWGLRIQKPAIDPVLNHPNKDESSSEPLSSRAVSIRKIQNAPFHEQFRTTDAFHNVLSSWNRNETNQDGQDDDEDDTQFFLHEEPESVQILFDAFLREGLIVGPSLTESVFLRSWHIHHIHEHTCWHSRVIELNGHWRTWFADVVSGWRDKNDPAEETIFSIVHPDPPRNNLRHEILFDIILAQGLEAPRKASLITVLQRDDVNARARFAVAASVPDRLSGYQTAQSAEVLHECNLYACTIRHGLMIIPYSMEPVHDMQDGDSFTIAVSTQQTPATASACSDSFVSAEPENNVSMHQGSSSSNDDPEASETNSDRTNSASRQGVHIFRLGHPPDFGRLRWDSADHILQDAARTVRVPPVHCICFHYLQVHPDDVDVQQESIILQHMHDIAPGSTEKLILIDVELHVSALGSMALHAPRVTRQVFKVVPTLTRSQVLQTARVAAYCEWIAQHSQGCFVFCNRVVWNRQDVGPRRIAHGMYLRIVIPPPPDVTWEIGNALRVFQDTADLFDQPAANRLAIEILNGNQPNTRPPPAPETLGSGTLQCKGADLGSHDIDIPMTNPPPEYRRRLRPEHDGTLQWLLELGQIFATDAEEEVHEEPMLYVQTWFIHHSPHATCRRPRPLRLERHSITWIDDFRRLWADVLERNEIFSLRIVRPKPPQERFANYACHVIVEQGVNPRRAACVITALLEGDRVDALIQGAYSLPVIVREQTIIDAMEIEPQCEGRCRALNWGQTPIHLVEATEIVSGCSIRVRITKPRSQLPICPDQEEPHFEDIALFQTETVLSRTCGIQESGGNASSSADGNFAFNTRAAEFRPGAWNIRAQPEHIQDLYAQWSQRAFSWEGEAAASHVVTWFVDHRHDAHCYQGRIVALYEDFEDWEGRIRQIWQDRIDPSVQIEFNLVTPTPPRLEHNVAAHVILIQAPHDAWVTSLVSALDPTIYGPEPRRAAITTHEHILVEHLLAACNYNPVCLHPWSQVHCQVWYDRIQLQLGMPIPGRSGYSIEVHVQRQFIVFTPVQEQQHDEISHLQTALGQKKRIISLEQSLEETPAHCIPISLIDGTGQANVPDQVFLSEPIHAEDVEKELSALGWQRHVYLLQNTGYALCLPIDWTCGQQRTCYVYYPVGSCERTDIILHSDKETLTDVKHMQILHSLGYCRAVVLHNTTVRTGLVLVQYHNNEPALEALSVQSRKQTPWPARMPAIQTRKIFDELRTTQELPSHRLELGIQPLDLQVFFESGIDVLCPWHSHLDLPEISRKAIDAIDTAEHCSFSFDGFDRLVIYTDGSSRPYNRRKPPLMVQETDAPDAWAFLVLGEKYAQDSAQSTVTLLGWHAQCVTYEEHLTHYLGTTQIGSEHSEREALFWASLWRLSINSNIPTVFRSDSVTTTDQSLGNAGCNDEHPAYGLLRSIFQALQAALPPECLDVQHVRGHAGDPWNEMVDYLAKTEASIGHKLKRQSVNLHLWRHVLPYFWMMLETNAGLPSFAGNCFDVSPPLLPKEQTADTEHPQSSRIVRHQIAVSMATCNVGSLFTGPEGYGGKLTFLRQQMKELQLNFLGVQEARSQAGTSVAEDVIRLAGGSDQGRLGVELWINMNQPIAYNGKKPCYAQRSNVQIVHADPRRLIARFVHPCIDCHICVLHAPQSGRPLGERRDWWAETNRILQVNTGSVSLYVLMDANAKTGSKCDPIIFDKDDHCSANTEFLRELLHDRNLCLPCTSHIHQGSDSTWTAPDGQTQHRIDFVAIPIEELSFCTHSCIVEHFDTGNAHEDHRASAVQLQWTQDRELHRRSTAQIGRVDRNAILEKRNLLDLTTIGASPWQADVETHVQSLNTALHSTLQAACPRHKSGRKKYYLTDQAWKLRSSKLHLRRRLQHARKQSGIDQLRLVFWTWKHRNPSQEHVCQVIDQHVAHVNTTNCIMLQLNCRYYKIANLLKQELQTNKHQQLAKELDTINEKTAAGSILQILKPFIGPTNPKKQKRTGLPAVRKKDGSVCATPDEAQARWIEFFSQMEGGRRLSHKEYRQVWRTNLQKFMATESFVIAATELPSLVELEAAYRRVSTGKAVGLDGIPPELCKAKATDLAKLTYSMLMKTFLHGQEAVEHKGGRLAVAWKNRGDPRDCETHRSLLISSHIGKTIHRALRQKHHALYSAYMQAQQLGGRPKIPVGIPLHLSRAFMRWQHRLKKPTACIFLDLAEAFYRLIRPLALGGSISDDDIAVIATRLGLDGDTLHQFHHQLQDPSALQQAGASPTVQRFLQALHCDTWFTIGTQQDVVRTSIGSRPGDSYADVVFGLLWAKLLRQYENALIQHEIIETIPSIEVPSLFDCPSEVKDQIPFVGPTWMDDLNVCIAAESNSGIERKTATALSILLDQCKAYHMEPNLRKGKTEVMFTFRGHQTRSFRRKYYSSHEGLPVVCEAGTVRVSVVSRYLHLGGILHHRDVDRAEVSRRLAIAHQAFTTHRRILYHNKRLTWEKRRELFTTLVLSKLVYGLESWAMQSQAVQAQFHGGILSLYRRLLKVPHDSHLTDLHVLAKVGLPMPDELLRSCRLRYFGTLHRCGSAANWGLLAEDQTWINLVQEDFQWLWTQICNTTDLPDPVMHYPAWRDLLTFHSTYWKKLVRRSIAHAVAQRQNYLTALELHQNVGQVLHDHGWAPCLPTDDKIIIPRSSHGCMQCQTRHLTHAGESVHMFKRHGRVAPARRLFAETHCPACLREYHTRAKVLAHLRIAVQCRQELLGRRMCCHVMPGVGSQEDRVLEENLDRAQPFLQAYGPHLPNIQRVEFDAHDEKLFEDIYLVLLDAAEDSVLESIIREAICRTAVSWTVCKHTLSYFLEVFTPQDAEF